MCIINQIFANSLENKDYTANLHLNKKVCNVYRRTNTRNSSRQEIFKNEFIYFGTKLGRQALKFSLNKS